MDKDAPAPRQVKFQPKAPPKRKLKKQTVPKTEEADDDSEAAEAQRLLRRFNEQLGRQGSKVEKKSSVQVAFGGAQSSTSIRTYGVPTFGSSGRSSASGLKESISDDKRIGISSPTAVESDGTIISCTDAADATTKMIKKKYEEPWDYHNSYYPTTLPLRQPYSGNPALLDEAEFGEAAKKTEYDDTINPASELQLLEESEKTEMFFIQLPPCLPLVKRPASIKGKEIVESSISTASGASAKGKEIAGSLSARSIGASTKGKEIARSSISSGSMGASKGCNFEELSGGYMGRMLVYKSGAVKLKLGETLYDVSPGLDCIFAQDVAAINTDEKHCCVLGELGKRMVVTPDIDFLLNSTINLD